MAYIFTFHFLDEKVFKDSVCCRLNMFSPSSHVEAITPNVTLFEDRTSEEIIKVK